MNIVLLEPEDVQSDTWSIHSKRQVQHLREHLDITVGQNLKVGIRDGARYITEIVTMNEHEVRVRPIREEPLPAKIPVHLILALPRPKVLRRLIMDSVTLGVEKISLIHSYRVDKSYWQTPFLQQIEQYITLGLEQAGDTIVPEIQMYKRFKPFVEDVLPTLISEESPAYVAHPYAEQSMPNNIGHACSVVVGPEGDLFLMKLIYS